MFTLSYLPTEVIIRLLCFLSPKELAPCARLSKQFLNIIRTSSILTYALELGRAGLEETYTLSFDRLETSECNPLELLAELRKRERGWSTFTCNKHLIIPVGKKYTNVEVCGSVFTGGYARFTEENGINTIDILDSRNVNNDEPVTTLSLDTMYSGYAVDPGQDLLVLFEKCAPTDRFCKLHLRNLSTGLEYEHAEITQSTLSLQLLDTQGYWMFYRSAVQIVGDYLLFVQHASVSSDVKTIFPGICAPRCIMISETELLMVGCGEDNVPIIEYYTISDFNPHSSTVDENGPSLQNASAHELDSFKRLNRVIFKLPFRNRPGSDIPKSWEAELILSEACYTPKPFSPYLKTATFVYHPNPRIIGMKFQNNDTMSFMADTDYQTHLSYTFDIFIHLDPLRKLKNKFSSISTTLPSDKIIQVPWKEWGPATTRVLNSKYNGGGWSPSRCIRGYYVLTYDSRIRNGSGNLEKMILDFNMNAWQSSTQGVIRDESEVLTCDGIRIASSLPYREIHMPYSQTRSEIQLASPSSILMGDDIICIEGPLPNTSSTHPIKERHFPSLLYLVFALVGITPRFSDLKPSFVSAQFSSFLRETNPLSTFSFAKINPLNGISHWFYSIPTTPSVMSIPTTSSVMSSLSSLPTEIIIRLLSPLSSKDLAHCTQLSKQFLTIIRTSSFLTYTLELSKAGLDETYHLNFGRIEDPGFNSLELLADLRKREIGLSTFTWNKHREIPVGERYTKLEVCGHVFAGGYVRDTEENGVNTIDVYDFHGPKTSGDGLITTLSLDALYCGYAIDAGQDLLVLIEKSPEKRYIRGSTVFFLRWSPKRRGVPLLKYYTLNDFDAISSELKDNGHSFEDETLCNLNERLQKSLDHVIFELPFENRPGSNISRTWDTKLIFSEASFTPKPFSPFVKASTFLYSPNPQVIGIKFQNIDSSFFMPTDQQIRVPYTSDIFIHLGLLRKLKDIFSSSSPTISGCQNFPSIPEVPWQFWGPNTARVFQDDYHRPWHRRTIRGYRVLIPDTSDYQMWDRSGRLDYMVLDFNTNAWDSSVEGVIREELEVVTCDGIKIISSLPYRKIRVPSYQSNRFGIQMQRKEGLVKYLV
ncbi:hypothetical protein Clacol_004440 [Clathrus columnatus]|uniref:F-box domain-containing protein n=1 Tax=Clathrus columnatus TaxID=1419009 RepID=A0AAV5A6F7_9AGAM|nr:hypothetical protein Clacol_004440 [Clathrus columnatus]